MNDETYAYVDGLNLRHAIGSLGNPDFAWCDIRKLLEVCLRNHHPVRIVKYYTSAPAHIPEAVHAHRAYIAALKKTGVEVVGSHFKRKERTVRHLRTHDGKHIDLGKKHILAYHEEKETDVKIAVDAMDDMHVGAYRKMILVSADTDFIPLIRRAVERDRQVLLLVPPNQRFRDYRLLGKELPGGRFRYMRIRPGQVEKAVLPLVSGNKVGNLALQAKQPE